MYCTVVLFDMLTERRYIELFLESTPDDDGFGGGTGYQGEYEMF